MSLVKATAEPPWLPSLSHGKRCGKRNEGITPHPPSRNFNSRGALWCCLGVWVLSGESKDVDEVEGRVTTFSGEVVGLVVLSGVGVLSGQSEDVDEVEGRADDVLG